MTTITDVFAREILDSRGNPTNEKYDVSTGIRYHRESGPCPAERQQANAKLLNCATEIKKYER